jgi:hypothetical protein
MMRTRIQHITLMRIRNTAINHSNCAMRWSLPL